jgi:hypothetical protein
MPDWRRFVRERLGTLGLSPDREEEIRAELADHLADQSQHADRPAEEIDWRSLACEIRRAEEDPMSHTAKTLWVPGVSVLLLASIMLIVVTRVVPATLWLSPSGPWMMLGPWLLSYFVFGALGAYWSRRAGGDPRARLLSGVFPLTLHLAIFVLPMIVAATVDSPRFPEHSQLGWLLRTSLGWIVIPGVALAVGAMPFLRNSARKPA